MKKRYTFIVLLIIMLYMIYLVLSYKYTEYRIYHAMQDLQAMNELYLKKIETAQDILENKGTKAYKNKILKSQQGLKNPGEEVVFLITEEKYKKYTQETINDPTKIEAPQNLLDEKSLIETMTVYQRWMYFLF